MVKYKGVFSVTVAALFMLLLIFDTTTAKASALEGVQICINVIIPSLFPFFVITTYLNSTLLGMRITGIKYIGRSLGIPDGCESILLIGLIGGYPVGAQLVADACRQKVFSKETARILLGYCSNAGPAFIFGVAGFIFSSKTIPIILWAIHILSALITGYLLPRPIKTSSAIVGTARCSVVQALKRSISICASVCAWVFIFKVGLTFAETIFLKYLDPYTATMIKGIFELSNGCIQLQNIDNEAIRFVIASFLLAFGGLCVALQTISITESIGTGLYFPGKGIQSCLSIILSVAILPPLFPQNGIHYYVQIELLIVSAMLIWILRRYCKKRCGNYEYNHV